MKGFAIKATCIVIVIFVILMFIQRGNKAKQARLNAAEAAEWKNKVDAAVRPILIKPWANYTQCGILKYNLRACDMRNWPGQVYPDEPIAGKKSPGIVWSCEEEKNADRRLPPRKVCWADASDARKRAYPCPELSTAGSGSPEDKHCVPANDTHSRMLRGENS